MGDIFRSWGDWLLNRSRYRPDIFRTVPGRFPDIDVIPAPVEIVNKDEFQASQSNYTLVVAATEYAVQGIITQSAINLKARGGAIQFSFYEGQSGAVYSLLSDGASFELDTTPFGVIGSPIAIYAQSPTAGAILEVIGLRKT